MMMRLVDALRCLLALLLLLPTATVQASGEQKSRPANGLTLAGCRNSCGSVSFEYPLPFGIGAGCFRPQETAGFELICNNHSASQAPRLFLHDGITEVINDVSPTYSQEIRASFSRAISLRSETNVYNMSWNLGRSFSHFDLKLNFTGCDFDMYVLEYGTNNTVGQCGVTCPDEDITDTVARQNCNGTGCCTASFGSVTATGFDFKFVGRHKIGKHKLKRTVTEDPFGIQLM